jgi:hypothetical protein
MKDFVITVPGTKFDILPNRIYTVIPKPDGSAPDGFKEHGTTKILNPDVGVTMNPLFNSAMQVWDTGFYEFSPCLANLSDSEKKSHLETVETYLVEPVERLRGKGFLRHNSDNKNLDDLVITLANKTSFNSNDPLQRLALYFAVLGKELCPKEMEGNPTYRQAAYMVVNRENVIANKAQKGIDDSKAVGEFYDLLRKDKAKLVKIFKYLNISATSIEDEDTFITVFNRFLQDKEDGFRNSTIFLQHLKKFNTEEGIEELHLYQLISDLYDKGEIKIIRSEYYLKDIALGSTLKHSAMFAVTNPEVKRMIVELSAEEED